MARAKYNFPTLGREYMRDFEVAENRETSEPYKVESWAKNGLYKVLCAGNLQKARAIFEQATKRGIGSRG